MVVVHAPQRVFVEVNRQADFGQFGIVVAAESVEIVGRLFGGAVAAPQIVFKEDSHLLHHRLAVYGVALGGNLEGGNQVLLAVGAHLANREL